MKFEILLEELLWLGGGGLVFAVCMVVAELLRWCEQRTTNPEPTPAPDGYDPQVLEELEVPNAEG